MQRIFYRFVILIFTVIFKIFGLNFVNIENGKQKGPYIVAANHVSNWDPIFVAMAIKSPVHFMSKVELFHVPVLGFLVRYLYAFPIERGKADRKAIRTALSLLQTGEVVGMFPEGVRNKGGEEIKAHAGVALLALKTGVPVLPIACVGTDSIFPVGWFRTLKVEMGDFIYPDSVSADQTGPARLETFSDAIMQQIHNLKQR